MQNVTNLEPLPPAEFPFQLIAAANVQADARTPVYDRKNYEVCTFEYILQGEGCLQIDDQMFYPKQDDIYMLPKGKDHAYWPNRSNPWFKSFFVIDGPLMTSLIDAYKMTNVYYVRNCAPLKHFFDEILALNVNSRMINQDGAIRFHHFIAELSRQHCGKSEDFAPEVQKLKTALDEAMTTSFNLEEYAKNTDYSEAHLIRIFRNVFNMTPYDYLMSHRIDLAKRLLLYASFSIKEIAAHLSFSDQYYFSNYFKQKCGMSPRNYRNKYLGIRRGNSRMP